MKRKKQPQKERSARIIPFPAKDKGLIERQGSFMTRRELLAFLSSRNISLSGFLSGQLKLPAHVWRGKHLEIEFFDAPLRCQPPKLDDESSPLHCVTSGKPPPSWLRRWYMALVEENGEKQLIFLYRPKGVFVKLPFAKAEAEIPHIMQEHTMTEMRDW